MHCKQGLSQYEDEISQGTSYGNPYEGQMSDSQFLLPMGRTLVGKRSTATLKTHCYFTNTQLFRSIVVSTESEVSLNNWSMPKKYTWGELSYFP